MQPTMYRPEVSRSAQSRSHNYNSSSNPQTCWEDDRWNEKVWKKVVVEQVEREGKRAWREEVEGKQDLGSYKDRQLVLERADYIANSSGDKIRAEIKGKCEWGEHFQI